MQLDKADEIKCLFKVVEAPNVTSEGLKEAREMRERLEDKLKRETKTMNEKIGEYLEKTEVKAEKDKITKFKEENLPKILAIKSKLMIMSPAKPVEQKSTSCTGERKEDKIVKNNVRTAPMAVTKWDGKSRTYPRFKKMWEENIIPFHESSALHMMLVQALPSDILD